MTQPISEAKTEAPAPLDANAEDAPAIAKNETLSNATAAAEAVKIEEGLTGNIINDLAQEVAVENLPDVKVAAAKDAAHLEPHEQVLNSGVEVKDEHAEETIKALDGTGASVVGETHPVKDLGQTDGTFNNTAPKEAQINTTNTLPAFNAMDSIKLEDPNTNGPGLNRIEEERRGLLSNFRAKWKILAGKKAA